MFRPYLSNIMADHENKLRIVDATLLEGKTVMPLGLILEILLPIIEARQKYLLHKFLI